MRQAWSTHGARWGMRVRVCPVGYGRSPACAALYQLAQKGSHVASLSNTARRMYRRRTEGGREGQEREEGGRVRRDLGRCSVWGVQDVLGIYALLSCWRLWRGSLAISGTVCRVAALAGAFVGGRPGERWGACIDTGTRGHDCGPCFALAGQVGPPSLVHAAAVPPPLLSPLQATSAACAPGLCSWVAVPAGCAWVCSDASTNACNRCTAVVGPQACACRPSVRVSYQLLVRRLCSPPVLLGLLWLVKPAWPCPALMRTAPESR
jgi:hypothetical protein